MQQLTPGITKANTGIDGISWNILGQTYVPKQLSRSVVLLARDLAARHIRAAAHPSDPGRIHLHVRGPDRSRRSTAANMWPPPGDLIRLPMNIPHGIFNKSDQTVKCLFWVTPTRKLYDLFWAIHGMKEQSPPDVVALSAQSRGDVPAAAGIGGTARAIRRPCPC